MTDTDEDVLKDEGYDAELRGRRGPAITPQPTLPSTLPPQLYAVAYALAVVDGNGERFMEDYAISDGELRSGFYRRLMGDMSAFIEALGDLGMGVVPVGPPSPHLVPRPAEKGSEEVAAGSAPLPTTGVPGGPSIPLPIPMTEDKEVMPGVVIRPSPGVATMSGDDAKAFSDALARNRAAGREDWEAIVDIAGGRDATGKPLPAPNPVPSAAVPSKAHSDDDDPFSFEGESASTDEFKPKPVEQRKTDRDGALYDDPEDDDEEDEEDEEATKAAENPDDGIADMDELKRRAAEMAESFKSRRRTGSSGW